MYLNIAPGFSIKRTVTAAELGFDFRNAFARGIRQRKFLFQPGIADRQTGSDPLNVKKILKGRPDEIVGYTSSVHSGIKTLRDLFLSRGGPKTRFALIQVPQFHPMFAVVRGGIERPTEAIVEKQAHCVSFPDITGFPVFVIKPYGDIPVPTPFEIVQAYMNGSPYGVMLARSCSPSREQSEGIMRPFVVSKYYYFPPFLAFESMYCDWKNIGNAVLTAFAQDIIGESKLTIYYRFYHDEIEGMSGEREYTHVDPHHKEMLSETVEGINRQLENSEKELRRLEKNVLDDGLEDSNAVYELGFKYAEAQYLPEALRIVFALAQRYDNGLVKKLMDKLLEDRLGREALTPFLQEIYKEV